MKNFLKSWDITRIIRLATGLLIFIFGIVYNNYMLLLMAGWFILLGMLNISCCGSGGCYSQKTENGNKISYQIKEYRK
ncbi:MAG: hypothetical protein LBP63_06170 [Prevotellaceae bacterium]|jgi:hypothetical protein|nr:hypothetical protein [Prevotellaceae bacterium]